MGYMRMLPSQLILNIIWWDYRLTKGVLFHDLQKLRHGVSDTDHSYQCFDTTKSIFIHTPKCAGVSVAQALYGNLAGGHTTLNEYIRIFEPKNILSYFKFSIVRNPWDRLVSAYFFLKGGGWGTLDNELFTRELSGFKDFNDFVQRWLCKENAMISHQVFKPQNHFILDKYEIVELDYIGRFEDLENSFKAITKSLKIESSLVFANQSKHNVYRDYYNEKSKRIVSKVYEKDIDYLKYVF
jgi:hypothetical protein